MIREKINDFIPFSNNMNDLEIIELLKHHIRFCPEEDLEETEDLLKDFLSELRDEKISNILLQK